eukprot:1194771-Prorocentrum_minimum.AAC.9
MCWAICIHVAYLTPLSHKTRIGEVQQHSSNTLTRLPSPSITVNDSVILRGGGYLNLESHSKFFDENILQLHPAEIVEPTGGGLADLGFIAMQDLYISKFSKVLPKLGFGTGQNRCDHLTPSVYEWQDDFGSSANLATRSQIHPQLRIDIVQVAFTTTTSARVHLKDHNTSVHHVAISSLLLDVPSI